MENKTYEIVDSVEKLEEAIARIKEAQKVFATYTQEQVDKIFVAAASAANNEKHIDFAIVKISSKLLVCISIKSLASKPYLPQL